MTSSKHLFAALLLLCVLAAAGCSRQESAAAEMATVTDAGGADDTTASAPDGDGEGEKKAKKKKRKKPRRTSVKAAPVTRADLVIPIVAEGSIRARYSTDLKFELAGRVTRVWVEEGQRVRKGQRLVSLDDREYRLALEEADSRYLKALGQLAVEEDGYASSKKAERVLSARTDELNRLERSGSISREERLDRELALGMEAVREGAYRRELLEVRSGLAAARADAARLKLQLEKAMLTAPFAGVVSGLHLTQGERVQLGEVAFRLVDDIRLEAELGVLESDLGSLEAGRRVLVTVPSLDATLPGKVDVVSADIDPASRTCSVLVRLDNQDGKLKPGMFVRAAIAGQTHPDRLLVPVEAIVTRDGRPVLFRIEDDRARWVYVGLGERNESLVEIARVEQGGPLEPDTLVVVDNHLTLTHDARVKVKKRVAIDDPWAAVAATEVVAGGSPSGSG